MKMTKLSMAIRLSEGPSRPGTCRYLEVLVRRYLLSCRSNRVCGFAQQAVDGAEAIGGTGIALPRTTESHRQS